MHLKWMRRCGLCLTLLVTCVILFFSLCKREYMPRIGSPSLADKIGHVLAYAALGFSLRLWRLERNHACFFCICYAVLLGGILELLQPFFGRTCGLDDVAADFVGALLGIIFHFLLFFAASWWQDQKR